MTKKTKKIWYCNLGKIPLWRKVKESSGIKQFFCYIHSLRNIMIFYVVYIKLVLLGPFYKLSDSAVAFCITIYLKSICYGWNKSIYIVDSCIFHKGMILRTIKKGNLKYNMFLKFLWGQKNSFGNFSVKLIFWFLHLLLELYVTLYL